MISTSPNVTMFGRRDRQYPVKAVLDNTVVALGANATDAKQRAQSILEDTFTAAQLPLVSRIAKDGTVFVARMTGADTMEYVIVRTGQYHNNGVMGQCRTSLARYMDTVVADYDACTASTERAQ